MELLQILEGWRNKLLPPEELKNQILEVSKSRRLICDNCEHYSENKRKTNWRSLRMDEHCTDCGCPLDAKTKCLSCKCPKDKWLAVATEEEHEEIKSIINGK